MTIRINPSEDAWEPRGEMKEIEAQKKKRSLGVASHSMWLISNGESLL